MTDKSNKSNKSIIETKDEIKHHRYRGLILEILKGSLGLIKGIIDFSSVLEALLPNVDKIITIYFNKSFFSLILKII